MFGPGAVLHAVADHVVDSYIEVAQSVENDIEEMEEAVFTRTTRSASNPFYQLKREVVELRRAVNPAAGPAAAARAQTGSAAAQGDSALLRDVGDHHTSVSERITDFDESLSRTGERGAGQDRCAAEHGYAQDLGLGRHRRGADHGGRNLWDELRLHVGAAPEVGLPGGARHHRAHLRGADFNFHRAIGSETKLALPEAARRRRRRSRTPGDQPALQRPPRRAADRARRSRLAHAFPQCPRPRSRTHAASVAVTGTTSKYRTGSAVRGNTTARNIAVPNSTAVNGASRHIGSPRSSSASARSTTPSTTGAATSTPSAARDSGTRADAGPQSHAPVRLAAAQRIGVRALGSPMGWRDPPMVR